jgi:hypothetical protein
MPKPSRQFYSLPFYTLHFFYGYQTDRVFLGFVDIPFENAPPMETAAFINFWSTIRCTKVSLNAT